MGFWGKLGKFAGRAAVGIIAPGALAGYDYAKAKATNEMLKGFDEAIEPLFKNLAAVKDDDDSWSELLVRLRSLTIKFLGNEEARKPLLKTVHPNEQARTLCLIMGGAFDIPEVAGALAASDDNRNLLIGSLNITEMLCQQLDAKIQGAGLETMEEAVLRMLYDMICTRQLHIGIVMYGRRNSDAKATFDAQLSNLIFPAEEDEDTAAIKALCAENKVSYDQLRRKLGL